MPIDPSLLIKAAKVYEAAEAVDGMKPKEVYESHKKCTPGEFGMNKEGEEKKAELESITPPGWDPKAGPLTNPPDLDNYPKRYDQKYWDDHSAWIKQIGPQIDEIAKQRGMKVDDSMAYNQYFQDQLRRRTKQQRQQFAYWKGQMTPSAKAPAAAPPAPAGGLTIQQRLDQLNAARRAAGGEVAEGSKVVGQVDNAFARGARSWSPFPGGGAAPAVPQPKPTTGLIKTQSAAQFGRVIGFGMNKEGADPRVPMMVEGTNGEAQRKLLGNEYYENEFLPERTQRSLEDAAWRLKHPSYDNPIVKAERDLRNAQQDLDWEKDWKNDVTQSGQDAVRATFAARTVAPFFGRTANNLASTAHNMMSFGAAADKYYDIPRAMQKAEHGVAQAQQALNYAKNPWERNPGQPAAAAPVPQPFKAKGIPGFFDRIGERIGNLKMPDAKQVFKALHPSVSRPFDALPGEYPTPAAAFGKTVGNALKK